jgi:hypothetical protein
MTAEQATFNFLFPYGSRTVLNTREVGNVLGREQDFVRALVDAGKLETHKDSALGERESNRITSRSVLLHLARTARYDPDAIADAICDVIATIADRDGLERIIRAANHRRNHLR